MVWPYDLFEEVSPFFIKKSKITKFFCRCPIRHLISFGIRKRIIEPNIPFLPMIFLILIQTGTERTEKNMWMFKKIIRLTQ